jgi:ribose transport system permease protein
LAISIMLGLGIGVISGYLVAYRKIAPFIATLAMMTIVRGAGFLFSKGAPISVGVHSSGILMLGTSSFLGIPFSAWILLIIFAAVFIGIRYHVFGRKIIAVGSNEEAVRLSGISVERVKFSVYVIAAFFTAIAALVIGGASLSGGRGSVLNTLLGVLILGMIGNIMNLLDVTSYLQQLIKGVIIILAVVFQHNQK